MAPKAKARKPKKPVLQKQKQSQNQRVVVNINQEKAKARRRARSSAPRQQMQIPAPQQIVLTGGSAPLPLTFNPSPVQSSSGFNIPQPMPSLGTPMNLNEPVALPTFAGETPMVIGEEQASVSVPVTKPVSVPTPIPVKQPPLSIITEIEPSLRPPPPTIAPTPIIKPAPPKSIITQPSRGIDKQFLEPTPTPTPTQSVSSLFSDISKETGITSQSVANFLFKKKKQEPKAPPPSLASSAPPSMANSSLSGLSSDQYADSYSNWSAEFADVLGKPRKYEGRPKIESLPDTVVSSQSGFTIPDDKSLSSVTDGSYTRPLNKSRKFVKDELPVEGDAKSFETISTRSGFYNEPFKGSFTNAPIIAEPKEVVVLKKPELKRNDPYDIFSDNDDNRSIASEKSLMVIPKMANEKPPKKRPVVMSSDSEAELKIIPQDAPAGRRMPPIKEKKSNYQSLAELQSISKKQGIDITRPNGKKKTREELRLEILGR